MSLICLYFVYLFCYTTFKIIKKNLIKINQFLTLNYRVLVLMLLKNNSYKPIGMLFLGWVRLWTGLMSNDDFRVRKIE